MRKSLLESMSQLTAYEGQAVEEGKNGDMPSKAHVEKMCKDGKSKKEICDMHPDCDQGKLKKMIDDCSEHMAEESQSIGEINDNADMSEAQKIRAMGDKLSAIFGTA
jgi:hypothetical protein